MNNKTSSTYAQFLLLGISCLLFTLLTSCIEQPAFEQNEEIGKYSWSNLDVKRFNVHISDSKTPYHLTLNIRHTQKYNFSEIALSVQETAPDSTHKTYRALITLAESDGRWKGTGTGNILQNQVYFLKNYHFRDTGWYSFDIKPIMSLNPLPGIVNIGLRLDKKVNP